LKRPEKLKGMERRKEPGEDGAQMYLENQKGKREIPTRGLEDAAISVDPKKACQGKKRKEGDPGKVKGRKKLPTSRGDPERLILQAELEWEQADGFQCPHHGRRKKTERKRERGEM